MVTAKKGNLGIPRMKHKKGLWRAVSSETEALSGKAGGGYWLSDSLAPEEHV